MRHDMIERLRKIGTLDACSSTVDLCHQAANEIERLMKTIRQADEDVEALQQKYDNYVVGNTL